MTQKQALESLKYEIDEEGHCSYIEEEIHIAMAALKKRIPLEIRGGKATGRQDASAVMNFPTTTATDIILSQP